MQWRLTSFRNRFGTPPDPGSLQKRTGLARRRCSRTTRQEDLGNPPYSYLDANRLFSRLMAETGLERPQYVWGALQGVNLAKALRFKRTSFLEFGVAGGNGLVALDKISGALQEAFNLEIKVHGFDTGAGLPRPADHRDLPNLWREGFYPMDPRKLKSRLKNAQLHLGAVEETLPEFIKSGPGAVSFISFDLDHYTSTVQAFKLFQTDSRVLLPRIPCYFDDIMAVTFSDFNGERLAIREFNRDSANRKISEIHGLNYFLPAPHNRAMWSNMMYMAHVFDHELYEEYDELIRETSLDLKENGKSA